MPELHLLPFMMPSFTFPVPTLLIAGALIMSFFQILLLICGFAALRSVSAERKALSRQLMHALSKLEGHQMVNQGDILRHYDRMLELLLNRLPPLISSRAGDVIFDIEKKILAKLANIQPQLSADDQRVDELITSMEQLEDTVVSLTGETVRQVMLESRQTLFAPVPSERELKSNLVTKSAPLLSPEALFKKAS